MRHRRSKPRPQRQATRWPKRGRYIHLPDAAYDEDDEDLDTDIFDLVGPAPKDAGGK